VGVDEADLNSSFRVCRTRTASEASEGPPSAIDPIHPLLLAATACRATVRSLAVEAKKAKTKLDWTLVRDSVGELRALSVTSTEGGEPVVDVDEECKLDAAATDPEGALQQLVGDFCDAVEAEDEGGIFGACDELRSRLRGLGVKVADS
jgi:hypothetical protein